MIYDKLETLEAKKDKFKLAIYLLVGTITIVLLLINASDCSDKTCDKGLKPALMYPGIRCVCVGEPK